MRKKETKTICEFCKRAKGHRSDCFITGFWEGYKAACRSVDMETITIIKDNLKPDIWLEIVNRWKLYQDQYK